MARSSRHGARRGPAPVEWLQGRHSIEEALRARRRRLHRLLVRRGPQRRDVAELTALAEAAGVPIEWSDAEGLPDGAGPAEAGYQGVVLEAGPLPVAEDARALLEPVAGRPATPGRRLVVALDGIEDPQNVGALARAAEASGAAGLLLTRRRSPPLTPALARASAGAIEWLPVARVPNLSRALRGLQDAGFWVIGADPEAEASLYEAPDDWLRGDLVLVLGAEGRGLRPGVRQLVDHPIRIPMLGAVASLNVASAAAVILYELLRRSQGSG